MEARRKTSENQVNRIIFLRSLAKEKLAEKTAIAINMDKIIERFSRKLDTDLAFFETDLKGCGEFETTKGAEPGSEVRLYRARYLQNAHIDSGSVRLTTWQVAFSVTPDVPVLSTTLARALTANSSSTSLARLAPSSATSAADASAGESLADKSMILGRVICYRADTGEYEILDVDDSKKYVLPERQVVILDLQESQRKLSKGETVFALYPDTTSFYPAVVSHAPRRTAMGAEPSVVVQFSGDEDENGEHLQVFVDVLLLQSGMENQSSYAQCLGMWQSTPATQHCAMWLQLLLFRLLVLTTQCSHVRCFALTGLCCS